MAVVYATQTLLGIVTLEDILEESSGKFMTRTMIEDYDESSVRLSVTIGGSPPPDIQL